MLSPLTKPTICDTVYGLCHQAERHPRRIHARGHHQSRRHERHDRRPAAGLSGLRPGHPPWPVGAFEALDGGETPTHVR